VKASAEARARAEIWISAYFDAISSAATCGTCQAWAQAWGYIEKWVFLEAIAKAEVNVCCFFSEGICSVNIAADCLQHRLATSIAFVVNS
jgi:hypothetical protein